MNDFKTHPIILASRASQLALAQAEEVASHLDHAEIATFSTRGDEVLDRPLADIGGKGLFVKTLERAMLAGEADAAVHSGKDMETQFAKGTMIAAFLERADRRDALIGDYADFDALPEGAVIGTASVRRAAMIKSIRPDLTTKLLRGNVNSRLAQLDAGHYDAIILAMAGMQRLGISAQVHPVPEDVLLPAASQGAIAIQTLSADDDSNQRTHQVMTALSALNHHQTAIEVTAERALLDQLDGTCETPIGASAHFQDGNVTLTAQLLSPDGSAVFTAVDHAHEDDAEQLGRGLADQLLSDAGGRSFLGQIKH